MKAIAVSNFPSDFNNEKFLPEFKTRGFEEVLFYTGPEMRDITIPSDIDVIFVFFDLMSHGQYDMVKHLGKKAKKRVILLQRKVASWPEDSINQLKPKEIIEMAAPKSVREEDVESMFRDYVEVISETDDPQEIVDRVSKWWTGRPLMGYRQLVNYINRLADERRAPQFYYDFLIKERTQQSQINSQITDAVTQSVNDQITDAVTVLPVPEEASASTEELLKMYEDDNIALTNKVKELESKVLELRQQPKTMKKGVDTKIVEALRTLVDANVIDPKQAFESLVRAVNG